MCPPRSFYNYFPLDYRLVCPSNNRVLHLGEYCCKGDKFFDQKNETWLWEVLTSRTPTAQRVQHFHPRARPGGQLSLLERLPGELIEEILDIILIDANRPAAVETVLLLGLSSDRLWPAILHRIHCEYRELATNWAGKRLGFHGSFSYPTQFQVETYSLQDSKFLNKSWQYWQFATYPGLPEEEWQLCATEVQAVCSEFSASEWEQIHQDLSRAYLYPQDRVWVLRNLTTNQFVRSDKICYPGGFLPPTTQRDAPVEEPASRRLSITKLWKVMTGKDKEIVVPSNPGADEGKRGYLPLTLAQVFLVLTCFSGIGNIPGPERALDFQQGPWAGHAFDVITLEEHEVDNAIEVQRYTPGGNVSEDSETGKVGWIDVSEVVAVDVGSVRKYIQDDQIMSGGAWRTREDTAFWSSITETRMKDRAWTRTADK